MRIPGLALAGLAAAGLGSAAAAAPAPPPSLVPGVAVVARTPLGAEVEPDRLPFASETVDQDALARTSGPALLQGLDRALGGVALDDAQGNPFQPNLIYRGFEASPLVGAAQGLAVYVNGTRFNQPFGDTVNWDLIPDVAIERVELAPSDPAFGLNALAGALSVKLKSGLGDPGGVLQLSGGSFGRAQAEMEYRVRAGASGLYVAATGFAERGWREHSPSHLGQLYADFGWKAGPAEAHLWASAARDALAGEGVAPVELLAADRRAVFTRPDATWNRNLRLGAALDYVLPSRAVVQARAYFDRLDQRTANGDAAGVEPCAAGAGDLCLSDGPPLLDAGGQAIADGLGGGAAPGGPYSLLNRTRTGSTGFGSAVQLSTPAPLLGRPNRLAVGASVDAAAIRFGADALIGGLSPDRAWVGPGVVVAEPDGSIAPVRARILRSDWAAFVSDTWEPAGGLALTGSMRFDAARLTLRDLSGDALDGAHRFDRLDPALGATYRVASGITAYAGWARSSRTPSPAELACASPDAPCSLTNFFVADPGLKAPVADTVEAGLRGGGAALSWRIGVFRSDVRNDIAMVASALAGRAYFANVGATRREGVEAEAHARLGRLSAQASYAYVAATFRRPIALSGGENPAVADGAAMLVVPGDRLPGVPAHSLKLSLDYALTDAFSLGASGRAVSGRYLLGDEANLNPKTPGYVVFDARAAYRIGRGIELFGQIDNLLDARYATIGAFSPTSLVPIAQAPGASDPRSLTPAAPRGVFGGVRLSF